MIRAAALVAAFFVAVVVATELAVFFETDSCLDAGGKYVKATGACSGLADVEYVAQLARPGLYAFWSIFLMLIGLSSWLVYKGIAAMAARFSSVAGKGERSQ